MKVCIESTEDGKFSVYEDHPMNNPGEGAAEGQTATTVDDALAMAKQILSGGADQNTPEQMFEQPAQPVQPPAGASMQAGFRKGRGAPVGY